MERKKRGWKIGVLVAVVVLVAGAGFGFWSFTRPIEASIQATIVEIDRESRAATIEYMHKKDGTLRTIDGRLADDAVILVNGEPATIADVRPGDVIEADGAYYPLSKQVVARSVNVRRRAAAPQTAPTDTADAQP